jgi:hypothetical protein
MPIHDLLALWGRSSRAGRVALAALALGIAAGAAYPFALSVARISSAVRHAGDTPLEGRRRIFGAAYTEGVEAVRRALPRDSAYALLEAGAPLEGGGLCLRYDLSPRRAIDLGRLEALPDRPRLESALPREVRWAVVSRGRWTAPLLLSREELLARSDPAQRAGHAR